MKIDELNNFTQYKRLKFVKPGYTRCVEMFINYFPDAWKPDSDRCESKSLILETYVYDDPSIPDYQVVRGVSEFRPEYPPFYKSFLAIIMFWMIILFFNNISIQIVSCTHLAFEVAFVSRRAAGYQYFLVTMFVGITCALYFQYTAYFAGVREELLKSLNTLPNILSMFGILTLISTEMCSMYKTALFKPKVQKFCTHDKQMILEFMRKAKEYAVEETEDFKEANDENDEQKEMRKQSTNSRKKMDRRNSLVNS